jgi:hypothetical protein
MEPWNSEQLFLIEGSCETIFEESEGEESEESEEAPGFFYSIWLFLKRIFGYSLESLSRETEMHSVVSG